MITGGRTRARGTPYQQDHDLRLEYYWAWHEQQEYTRNHQARYRNTLILTA
ncbi:hypothetical protein [Streptomyces sp. NBRC 110035]|uniref:hypothetical protein n=1 Tax=Streptomyces sp. NBRC 110035 TaxID=1547867 RepID=UPI00131CB7EC|nr:hypothetical protein [Streptomyces sp. NBRC 110035]